MNPTWYKILLGDIKDGSVMIPFNFNHYMSESTPSAFRVSSSAIAAPLSHPVRTVSAPRCMCALSSRSLPLDLLRTLRGGARCLGGGG
jgi:hypothetical protein